MGALSATDLCKDRPLLAGTAYLLDTNARESRPEYATLLRFVANAAGGLLEQCVPKAIQIKRTAGMEPTDLANYLVRGSSHYIDTPVCDESLQRCSCVCNW